jgi:flagellin
MGLRVNTNITAITAQRNLTLADSRLFRSVQRLSSGLRINSAGDDPAGLAISEQLRAQIAGLNAAIVNSERAINLVQTIEGALNEVNSLLIGMRELALDAANSGINNATSLAADQAEIANALQTITRISDTTTFSIQTLLDGTFENQVSLTSLNTIGLTRYGDSTLATGSYTVSVTNITQASAQITSDPFDLLDNVALGGTGGDGDPDGLAPGSHRLVISEATGAHVTSDTAAIFDGSSTLSATTITISSSSGTSTVTFEGDETNTIANIVAEINDEARDLVNADDFIAVDNGDGTYSIAIDSNNTAVGASQTITIEFADAATAQAFGFATASVTAANGENVGVQLDDGDMLRLATGTTEFVVHDANGGALTLTFEVAFATQNLIEGATLNVEVTPATFDVQVGSGPKVSFTSGDTKTVSAGTDEQGNSIGTIDLSFGYFNVPPVDSSVTLSVVDNSIQFQVGPNPNQTVKISAQDISSDKLALGVINQSNFRSLNEIDVTTVQGANDAVLLVDQAIDEISRLRAKLGAFQQNTLETNLRSLRIAEENLAASESTIRDVDISQEIAEFTKNQILLSAGVSVLAQANAIPQTVLQLLG